MVGGNIHCLFDSGASTLHRMQRRRENRTFCAPRILGPAADLPSELPCRSISFPPWDSFDGESSVRRYALRRHQHRRGDRQGGDARRRSGAIPGGAPSRTAASGRGRSCSRRFLREPSLAYRGVWAISPRWRRRRPRWNTSAATSMPWPPWGARPSPSISCNRRGSSASSRTTSAPPGSGEFLVQQVGRLGLDLEAAIDRSFGGNVVPLASRCSVHCKSDITHKLNRQEASVRGYPAHPP